MVYVGVVLMTAIIEEKYASISPAEFFYKYREVAGFSNPVKAFYQAIKELVDNALDATDMHGILPDVKISIERADEVQEFYKITVEDNGIGIPPDIVPYAFGKVLFSSKYSMKQSRGMYGLGVKMVVLYAQMTTGRPVEVTTSRENYRMIYYFKLRIDVNKNEPVIIERGAWRKTRDWHGTVVSVTIEGDWNRAKQRILEYLHRTSIITPYANMTLITPENEIVYYSRATTAIPRPPRETKPHPQGIDLEMLKILLNNNGDKTLEEFLASSFQSIGPSTAKILINTAGINPSKKPQELTEEEVQRLFNTIKNYDKYRPPLASSLSPLGRDVLESGLKRIFEPEFLYVVSRSPRSYEGHPFIVEAGVSYGGKTPMSPQDQPFILRYANRVPLIYDESTDVITQVVREDINWDHYMISFPTQLTILVHLCSTKIPFRGVGKESIADVPEIRREIRLAIMEAARELKRYLARKAREKETMRRVETIAKYIPEIARSLSVILGDESSRSSVEKALTNKLVTLLSRRSGIPFNIIDSIVKSVEIGV
jgi:DNA topoisomerase-6 subunit B